MGGPESDPGATGAEGKLTFTATVAEGTPREMKRTGIDSHCNSWGAIEVMSWVSTLTWS